MSRAGCACADGRFACRGGDDVLYRRERVGAVAARFCGREVDFALRRVECGVACAVRRHGHPVGANPTRQLSLRPVATEAVVEVTKRLKPSV